MICANCKFERDMHPKINGEEMCLQKPGTFRMQVESYTCELVCTDADKKPKRTTMTVVLGDTSRVGAQIQNWLNLGYTNILVKVLDSKYK